MIEHQRNSSGIKKIFVFAVIAVLLVGCFSTLISAQLTADTSIISMGGKDWSLKVDSTVQTTLDSKNQPYASVQKGGTEKELFLQLNSLKDCVNGQVQFKVETQGLTIYKQLPLTEEEIKFGCTRPENVVNSFACFNSSGQKVLHIYASKMIDAKNNTVWLDSDLKDGLLTVYLDQKWLDTATFPVIVDPTFGYTSVGASENDGSSIPIGCKFTTSEKMTVNEIAWYGQSSAGSNLVQFAIYTDNAGVPNELVTNSSVFATNIGYQIWVYKAVSCILNASQTYWLEFAVDNHFYMKYDNGASNQLCYGGGSWEDFPQTHHTPSGYMAWQISIYANYELYVEPSASPSATPTPTATTDPLLIGLIIFALFTGLCFYLMLKPHGTINFVIGILMLSVTGFLAVGQYFGSLWIIAFAGAIFGLITMLRGTDLM